MRKLKTKFKVGEYIILPGGTGAHMRITGVDKKSYRTYNDCLGDRQYSQSYIDNSCRLMTKEEKLEYL